jgi:hypothetical protein
MPAKNTGQLLPSPWDELIVGADEGKPCLTHALSCILACEAQELLHRITCITASELQHPSPGESTLASKLERTLPQPIQAELCHLLSRRCQYQHSLQRCGPERLIPMPQEIRIQPGLV